MPELDSRVSAVEFQIAEFQAQLQSVSQTMTRMEDKLTRVDEKLATITQQTNHPPVPASTPANGVSPNWYDRIIYAVLGLVLGTGGTAGIGSLLSKDSNQYQPPPQYYYQPARPDLQAPRQEPTVQPIPTFPTQ